jgi:hypothetical protein
VRVFPVDYYPGVSAAQHKSSGELFEKKAIFCSV